jgi:hypothetical protein
MTELLGTNERQMWISKVCSGVVDIVLELEQ